MAQSGKMHKYLKFLIYMVVIILLNIVGINLFFRLDLTQNRLYALSDASRKVVSNLQEPLTIKVFFTRNLPAPHNGTEQYLQDLLKEYDLYANRHFNYRFYDVSSEEGNVAGGTSENQKVANDYGIYPVQIQVVEKDEVKFMKAYMGMVMINGDLIEKIPTITDTDQLEYRITTSIGKLNNKVSALLKLQDKIKVKLYMSSSLEKIAPFMQLENVDALPGRIEGIVKELNDNHFGKIEYEYIDPSVKDVPLEELKQYQVLSLKWPALKNGEIQPGQAAVGLAVVHGDRSASIPLINAVRIPIIGTQYSMTDLSQLDDAISENIESLIDINEDIGYLASHGTLRESPPEFMNMPQMDTEGSISSFKKAVSQNYTFKEVDLKSENMPDAFNTLIIGNPTEPFSEDELFQIDQLLMRGKNLAIFADPFRAMQMDQQNPMMGNAGPVFLPLNTGLEKLLAHYGISREAAYVLDKNCYKQQINPRFGGGERPIYFAPLIENRNITHSLDFMKSIKGLIAIRIAPLTLKQEILDQNKITAHPLFFSSDQSWEMKGQIQLNPEMIQPPLDEGDYRRYPLAYLLEGEFTSYFKGKPIPEKKKEAQEETAPESEGAEGLKGAENEKQADPKPSDAPGAQITPEGAFIEKGKPAKILFIASAEMLKDNVVDEEGKGPNTVFLLNALDALNGRSDIAVLRGKEQRFNPLQETSAGVKAGIKFFNVMGLPVLVVLFGLVVWIRRHGRKKQIQMMFQK